MKLQKSARGGTRIDQRGTRAPAGGSTRDQKQPQSQLQQDRMLASDICADMAQQVQHSAIYRERQTVSVALEQELGPPRAGYAYDARTVRCSTDTIGSRQQAAGSRQQAAGSRQQSDNVVDSKLRSKLLVNCLERCDLRGRAVSSRLIIIDIVRVLVLLVL